MDINMGAVEPHPAPKKKAKRERRKGEGLFWKRMRERMPREKENPPRVKVISLPIRSESHPQKIRKTADRAPVTAKREAAQVRSTPKSTRYFT
jgi:hypothetical protein